MASTFTYPIDIETDEAGFVLVTFPDVPEAGTDGVSVDEALAGASDSLIAALGGYIQDRRPIPNPSPARGRNTVALPPLIAAKLALYQSMVDHKLTRVALAEKLGLSEGAIRRLLDLDHRSHIAQVEAALAVLGKRLEVRVYDAA